jgi:hypothetical protein
MSYRRTTGTTSQNGKRALLTLNAGIRLAYGIGGLVSPPAMEKAQLAPDTPERPDARLFVRAFSAHQIGVAALGLAALGRPRLQRPAAIAAVAIDVADILSGVVEAAKREGWDADLKGGIAFSGIGALSATMVMRG